MADRSPGFSRWWLVAAAAVVLGITGTFQFAWSTIRPPLGERLAVSGAELGTVFTLFVIAQTLSQFPAGWVRDRRGPRGPLLAGAVLMVVGFGGLAVADSFPVAAVAYAVGGAGSGFAYTVAVNTPVKWFTDRRGLATGAVTMTFGATSFLVIPVLRPGLEADFRATLFALAGVVGAITLLGAAVLRDPPREATRDDGDPSGTAGVADGRDAGMNWRGAVRTWQFWVLYLVFVAVNGVGLMLIGKSVSFATRLGLSAGTATAAASFIALADGAGIVVVGGLSDRLGRERTIAASLVMSGVALAAAVVIGRRGLGPPFVLAVAAAAFFRSPAFSVFPSLVGDYYGATHSSANYALMYTAKLWGGVIGGTGAAVVIASVGWGAAFLAAAAFIAVIGASAAVLRPPKKNPRGSGP